MIARDIAFNIAGRVIPAIITFASVPIYLSYVGEKQYAFIGLLVTIQSIFLLLDGGFSSGYLRRVAEFSVSKKNSNRLSDLTVSVELIFLLISSMIFLLIYFSSNWLAINWLKSNKDELIVVAEALGIMAAVVAVRFLILPYYACLKGFSKFDWINILNVGSALAKTCLAILALEFYSSSVVYILIAFLIVYIFELLVIRCLVFFLVPYKHISIKSGFNEVFKIKKFIGGMALISLFSALLSQLDKVVVSSLLPLEVFSYYSMAALLATIPLIISTPIAGAVYPKLVQSVSKKSKEVELQYLYAAKYIAVLVFPICTTILLNSEFILYLWTQNESVMLQGSGPLSVLIVANTILSIMSMPYFISLSYGDTAIPIKTNLVAIIVSMPAFYYLGSNYGAIGISFGWLIINLIFILIYTVMIRSNNYLSKACIWEWVVNVNLKSLVVSLLFAKLMKELLALMDNITLQVMVILVLSLINVFSCYKLVKNKSEL